MDAREKKSRKKEKLLEKEKDTKASFIFIDDKILLKQKLSLKHIRTEKIEKDNLSKSNARLVKKSSAKFTKLPEGKSELTASSKDSPILSSHSTLSSNASSSNNNSPLINHSSPKSIESIQPEPIDDELNLKKTELRSPIGTSRGLKKIEKELKEIKGGLQSPELNKKSHTNSTSKAINTLLQYKNYCEKLGIGTPAKKTYTSSEKINRFIKVFLLLEKLDVYASRGKGNITLDILVELKACQQWLLDKSKFNANDIKCLDKMLNKRKDPAGKKLSQERIKMLEILNFMLSKNPTDFMLRNALYALRAFHFFEKKGVTDEIKTKDMLQANDQLVNQYVSDFKKLYRSPESEIHILNSMATSGSTKAEEKKEIKLKPIKPLNNKFVNLNEFIYQCEEKAKKLNTILKQSSIESIHSPSFFRKNKNEAIQLANEKNKTAMDIYYLSEDVILTAHSILQDRNIKIDKQTRLGINTSIAYHWEVNQQAFKQSKKLQSQLIKEKKEEKFAAEIAEKINFEVLSDNILNKEKYSSAYIERISLQGSLKEFTSRPKLTITFLGGGNNSVFLFHDPADDVAVIVRAREINKQDETLGKSQDKFRVEVVGSLDGKMTTRLIKLITGVKEYGENPQDLRRRDYEISQAILGSKNLLDEFVALHAGYTNNNDPLAILKFQLSAINYIKQLVEGIVYLAKKNICSGDTKPGNLLLSKNGTVKVSDIKGYRMHSSIYLPNLYCDAFMETTPGFYTAKTIIGKNEKTNEKITDLELLRRETLAFTILQLLTLADLDPRSDSCLTSKASGAEGRYEILEKLSNGDFPSQVYVETKKSKEGKEEEIKVPAIPIAEMTKGTLGQEIHAILEWTKGLVKNKYSLEAILNYFKQNDVQNRLLTAEKELHQAMQKNAQATEKMSL